MDYRREAELIERASRFETENAKLREALVLVRSIIKDGAVTGFNHQDGDWAERLFASQAVTHEALK